MKDITRKNPHPNYGNWCGGNNTHENWDDANPIDAGDAACRIHDFALSDADKLRTRKKRADAKKKADAELRKAWHRFKPIEWWGKLYRRGLLFFFN